MSIYFYTSFLSNCSASAARIISLCALPDGIIGKQFSFGSTQIGTPREVYNRPKTAFVATFLGETSSFTGRVDSVADHVAHVVMEEGFRSAVRHDGDVAKGDRLTISIRPERVKLARERPAQTENVFAGTVDFVEYLGAYAVYLIRLDGGKAMIEASEPIPSGQASFEAGDHVFASWDVEHVVYVQD